MKKKSIFLLALTVALVLSVSIQPAIAYFTTYAEARGSYVIRLGDTHIDEEFANWTKTVTIVSDADAQDVYVRAIAFSGDQFELAYSGDGWTLQDDGYYYYDQILHAGERTAELLIHIANVPADAVPEDGFNVVVVYESTPVQYDENGNPYADWNIRLEGGDEA